MSLVSVSLTKSIITGVLRSMSGGMLTAAPMIPQVSFSAR